MSTIDFILLGLLLLGAFSGYRTGLILELLAILALVLGIIGGLELLHIGMDLLSSWYDGFGPFLPILAFLLIFILIIVLVNIVGRVLKRIIDWTPLGAFDKIAGAVLGILKWALGLSVVLWIISTLGITLPESLVKSSRVYPLIADLAPKTVDLVARVFPGFGETVRTLLDFLKDLTG